MEDEGLIVLGSEEKYVSAGDTVIVPRGELHAIKAISELSMVEVQHGHPLIEEDIERFPYTWKN